MSYFTCRGKNKSKCLKIINHRYFLSWRVANFYEVSELRWTTGSSIVGNVMRQLELFVIITDVSFLYLKTISYEFISIKTPIISVSTIVWRYLISLGKNVSICLRVSRGEALISSFELVRTNN